MRLRLDKIPRWQKVWNRIKVDRLLDCWEWQGNTNGDGYGQLRLDGKHIYVHRYMYETFIGLIETGKVIDHLCRNRLCVNPLHLEPVTTKINLLRGNTYQARNASKTHCKQGHLLQPLNLVKSDLKRGWRNCLICYNARQRVYLKEYRRMRHLNSE